MREQVVCATAAEKTCSVPAPDWPRCTRPPRRKHMPMTSKRLDRIEPSMDDWTTWIWPSLSATMLTCTGLATTSPHIQTITHNQLDGISKRRIQKSAHGLAQLQGNLLGRKRQDGGERDDGEEVDGEDSGRVPLVGAGDDANGHGQEQEVDIVCGGGRLASRLGESLEARELSNGAGTRTRTYC